MPRRMSMPFDPRPSRSDPHHRSVRKEMESSAGSFGWEPVLALGLTGLLAAISIEKDVQRREQRKKEEDERRERRERRNNSKSTGGGNNDRSRARSAYHYGSGGRDGGSVSLARGDRAERGEASVKSRRDRERERERDRSYYDDGGWSRREREREYYEDERLARDERPEREEPARGRRTRRDSW